MSDPSRCQEDFERRRKSLSAGPAITERRDGYERRIDFVPGYDHRAFPEACGGGGHGQHGMEMGWYLIGPKGVVQWKVTFCEMVPGNISSIGDVPTRYPQLDSVMAFDLGYHSPTPTYEGQGDYGPCDLLPGDKCYYDGSGLNAGPVLNKFMWDGPAAVWAALADYYADVFGTRLVES